MRGNAEVFVNRMVRRGLLTRDAAVAARPSGDEQAVNTRTAQRHFLFATGMSHTALKQIERARFASQLLTRGTVAERCGSTKPTTSTRRI